jgi:hypothetical protein
MNALEQTATQIAGRVRPVTDRLGMDFITIIALIMEILSAIFPILQNLCKNDAEKLRVTLQDVRPWHRIWLRWHVRKVLGWRLSREIGREVVNGALVVGKDLSVEDVANLYAECD